MSVRNLCLSLLFALSLSVSNCYAYVMEDEVAVAFAGFISDLVRTTQGLKHGVICGAGGDEVSKIIASQDKGFINIDSDPGKIDQCKAVYIAQGREKGLRSEIERFNNKKILTIAIFDGFTEIGGMLQVQMGRRNFELTLNSRIVKDSGIRLSALATSLVIN